MKKRLLLFAFALAFALSGCSSLLNREHSFSAVHVENPVNERATILQAENHQGLVNALLYFVTEHEESGIIHLSNYSGEEAVEQALSAACREVRTEDPLGAYAVASIQYAYSHIVSYYEASIAISYAHTEEEVAAITSAAGSTAIRQTVSAAMSSFSPNCVFRVSYFTGDTASLLQLARQTWLDTPLAPAQPLMRVRLYPNGGTSRIVELSFRWPKGGEDLIQQRTDLEQRALALLEAVEPPPEALTPLDLLAALGRAAAYAPEGGASAYHVLVDGRGNDQGMAQALRLLCQLADLEATVVEGSLDGQPRFWLVVATAEGFRHLDPSAARPAYATDEAFLAAGYLWDAARYPACTDYAAPVETDPPGDEEDPGEEDQPPQEDGPASAPEQGGPPAPRPAAVSRKMRCAVVVAPYTGPQLRGCRV